MSVCFMATHLLRTRLASSYPSLILIVTVLSIVALPDQRSRRYAIVRPPPEAILPALWRRRVVKKTRHMVRNAPNTDVLPPADGTLVVSMESRGMGNI